MNNKVYTSLEFNKIKKQLEDECITYLGKEKVVLLEPSTNITIIKKLQKETSEAVSFNLKFGCPPIYSIPNIELITKKVAADGILNLKELIEVANILKLGRNMKQYFYNDEVDTETFYILNSYFENIYSNPNIEEEIFRCIASEDELYDKASPTLYNIRKKILDTENKIKDKLNSIVRSSAKYLQDTVITFRNDRYVVPVKQEYKSEIQGLVHDSSSSGSTIFIEPTVVFNLNNEIKELKIDEKMEIERILSLLTQMVTPVIENITSSIMQIGKIDFAFAKAKYSLKLDAFEPKVNESDYINLKKARHPLIDPDRVVPVDVWLGKDFDTLIITGPNTGGKTVTLKTVGLLTIMAQSGMHIPASENSEIRIFKNIFTDIGDEQSIEQSLSTFSAHMKNIIEIVNDVSKDDLVLLDELGAGTDPTEGAALAMSILEFLHNKKCLSISTTHYSELKVFAMQTEGIENAACEFDLETLRPTYKLLIGIPGRSNAFAISKKLGLLDVILDRATSLVSSENIKFEDVLGDMERDRRLALEERDLSKKILHDASKTKEELENERQKLEQKKNEILAKAKQEARDLLLNAEEEANEIIKELTNLKKEKPTDLYKKAEMSRSKLKKNISEISKDLIMPAKKSTNLVDISKLKVGMNIYVPSLDQNAKLLSLPDKKNNITIQSGIVKLNIHISQIQLIKEEEKDKKVVINSISKNKSQTISSEIKLLGMTVDEAVSELEKYLDDAYLAGLPIVRVVHGKGSGLLRNGVHEYLKKNPHVASYRIGTYGEGDTGVTIVELK